MAYVGNYTTADLDEIVIDGVGTAGVVVIGFVALIVIIMLYGFAKKRVKPILQPLITNLF